jgi:hypothetical protein
MFCQNVGSFFLKPSKELYAVQSDVKFSLYLTEHQAMKAYGGEEV